MGFYSDFMGFYSDFMGFYGGLMGFYGGLMGFNMIYPLVICYIAIENGHEKVGFPINSMVMFHSYVNGYQRVLVISGEKIYPT